MGRDRGKMGKCGGHVTRTKKQGSSKEVSLAEHIRHAAKESGLSVYRIAKEVDLDQSALNRFLNGTRDNIRLDVANRLFKFFGLRVIKSK